MKNERKLMIKQQCQVSWKIKKKLHLIKNSEIAVHLNLSILLFSFNCADFYQMRY